jgi:hypothetical protein
MAIGYLRLVSQLDNLSLRFEGASFKNFVDRKTLKVDSPSLLREIKNNSNNHTLEDVYLLERIKEVMSDSDDPWQVSCGDDIVELLSFGFQKTLAAQKGGEVSTSVLKRSLRLAYNETEFAKSEMYRAIRVWEVSNPPFKIL